MTSHTTFTKLVTFSTLQRRGDLPGATKVHQCRDCKRHPAGHSLNMTWDILHIEKEIHQLAATSHKTISPGFVDTHAYYASVGSTAASPAASREALQELTPAGKPGDLSIPNFF